MPHLTPSCIWSWSTGVTKRYLFSQYYSRIEVHTDKAWKNKFPETSNILLHYVFFNFKMMQQDLITYKSNQVKRSFA